MKKLKDLLIILVIYILAFVAGYFSCFFIENIILKFFVFDIVATVVTFIFSTILRNSSVYDAYWSLTPFLMSIWLFIENRAFSPMQLAFLLVFNVWAVRLTVNWITVFTDFSYEDWRYKKFRNDTNKFLWPIVNFAGIHLMPTLVVFAGMLPLFEISTGAIGSVSIIGMLVMLFGVALEHFADSNMHKFLATNTGMSICREGLWNYSRHPNYLGEISFWLGVFLAMVPYAPEKWYYGAGFAAIAIMFMVVSIPLMEKRQKARRPEYVQYCQETSRLLILPSRRSKAEELTQE